MDHQAISTENEYEKTFEAVFVLSVSFFDNVIWPLLFVVSLREFLATTSFFSRFFGRKYI